MWWHRGGLGLSIFSGLVVAATLPACNGDDSASATDGQPTATVATTVTATGTTSTTSGTDSDSDSASGTASDTATTGTTADTTTTTATTTTATTSSTTVAESESATGVDTTTGGSCTEGEIVCEGLDAKVCDANGELMDLDTCTDACADGIGCTLCVPGDYQCNGDVSELCNDQGDAWEPVEVCDGMQGVTCDADAGTCVGACSAASLGLSYIGCDYYPTTTAGLRETNPWPFNYAVVVANTSDEVANIIVTRGANTVTTDSVGSNTAKVITLPYVDQLSAPQIGTPGTTIKVADGAYRLRSDKPVTVYQYNPLEYKVGNSFSFINDAGLLLPVNTWTGTYRVVSRNHWPIQSYNLPGVYAVTASQDGTTVQLTPSASGGFVAAGAGVAANGTGTVMLDQGDVLEVFTVGNGNSNPNPSDLTGTLVEADKPVQVIGGHKCTNVPWNVQYCDRLEETIPPVETLAKDYLVTAPLIPTGGNTPKAQLVRIVATESDTNLTYEPAQPGAPAVLANAGDWAELPQSPADYSVSSDKKILVAQYMLGQNAGGNSGDPAMTLTTATEQFRDDYLVHAPTNYEYSYANVIAPSGANITLDGAPVSGFAAIGNTGYSVARVTLSNGGDGNHTLTGDDKFGISVYGYGQYTSYWYPGGLDLKVIPQ